MSYFPSIKLIPFILTDDVKVECDRLISDDGHGLTRCSSNLENASDFHRLDFQITKEVFPRGSQSIEFKEEIDIKEEADMGSDLRDQDDLLPDWKLTPNVECRVRVRLERMNSFSSVLELNGSTRNLGSSTRIDNDLSDMFLVGKTVKVEPPDVDMNSEDPLRRGGLMDSSETQGEIKEVNSRSTINSDGSFGSSSLDPDLGNKFTIEKNQTLKLRGTDKISEELMIDLNLSIGNRESGDLQENIHETTLSTEKVTFIRKQHRCHVCGKAFKRKNQVHTHKLIHTGERPHVCDLCGKCFTLKGHLTQQKATHTGEKPVYCDVCGKRYARKGDLNRHKLMHPGETPYKCHTCGEGYTRTDDLNRHKLTHTAENTHKCDICEKCFVDSSQLSRHKRIHSGDKPYACEVCRTTFADNSNLNRHKLTHTADKPYECEVCGMAFSLNFNLTRHKNIHSGDKPYECEVCEKDFARKSDLNRHKVKHIPEKRHKTK